MAKFDSAIIKKNRYRGIGGIINILFILFLVVLVISGTVAILNYQTYAKFVEFKTSKTEKIITIPQGAGAFQVTEILAKEEIIPSSSIFGFETYKIYFYLNEIPTLNLKAGEHSIPENVDLIELLKSFEARECPTVEVTLIEGMRIEEFAEILSKNLNKFDKEEFIRIAKNFQKPKVSNLKFEVPTNLEGYLFPDTYKLCVETSPNEVILRMLDNFNSKYISEISLLQEKENKYSLNEIINIASMLEREAKLYEDKQKIADIIRRRLEEGITLGIDATTQYEFGYSESQQTWWRKGAELDELINTPHEYSTRKNTGLPPTPISNPGLETIRAVYNFVENPYYFYVSDDKENIYFAETLQEHNVNVCKYVTKECL